MTTGAWCRATTAAPAFPSTAATPSVPSTIRTQLSSTTRRRQPVPVPCVRDTAGQLQHCRAQRHDQRSYRVERLLSPPAQAKAATLRYIRTDPNLVYVGAVGSSPGGMGALQRCDLGSGQIHLINVWPQSVSGTSPGRASSIVSPGPFRFCCLRTMPESLYTCGNIAFRSTRPGPQLGRHQPGSDPRRRSHAGGLRRAHHPGHERRGALRDDLRLHRVAARSGRLLGRQRRRPGAYLARQRRLVARRHTVRSAGTDLCLHAGVGAGQSRQSSIWPAYATNWMTRPRISTRPRTTARRGRKSRVAYPRRLHQGHPCRPAPAGPALRRNRTGACISPSTMAKPGSDGRPTSRSRPSSTW